MPGTLQGAANARQTLIKKHGGYEKYLEYMRNLAAKGGKNGDPQTKGFCVMDREKHLEISAKGGRSKNVQHTTV